ncbi:MAG: hypothetical protein WAP51_03835 [Candidatus Sungiibacteriota bacterium]
MEATLYAAMIWVSAVTGWDMPPYRPAALPMSPAINAITGGMSDAVFFPNVGPHGTIYFQRGVDEAVIVHEVVHFFQRERGENPRTSKEECLFELKAEEIENLWRAERGLPEARPYYELCGKFMKGG